MARRISLLALIACAWGLTGCDDTSSPSKPSDTSKPSDASTPSDADSGSTNPVSSAGVGRPCDGGACPKGQECVTGEFENLSTCEIRCTSEDECPEGLRCNLPPILPDSLPNVCVDD